MRGLVYALGFSGGDCIRGTGGAASLRYRDQSEVSQSP
jgi:hypothetical protein